MVHFAFDKADITQEAMSVLDSWVDYLNVNPTVNIEVSGHADSPGEDLYNLVLSKTRADNVKKYLIDRGVSSSRISVAYYGEGNPVAPDDPVMGNIRNRRVEIRLR